MNGVSKISFSFQVFGAHCFGIIADILKVPMIGVSSSVLYPWSYDYIACPHNLAYAPHNLLFYSQNMNFWQRMYNFLDNLYSIWAFNRVTVPQTEIMRKYVKPDAPDIRDLERNMSIILVNSHISTNGIKNLNPALIEVGGLHVHDDETVLLPPVSIFFSPSLSVSLFLRDTTLCLVTCHKISFYEFGLISSFFFFT